MAEILNLPPNLPKSQNAEVGASKFCPGCGHGITLKALDRKSKQVLPGMRSWYNTKSISECR